MKSHLNQYKIYLVVVVVVVVVVFRCLVNPFDTCIIAVTDNDDAFLYEKGKIIKLKKTNNFCSC